MEPCHLIAEEWGSLSGQFTAEEADFMSQLLGHGGNYSVTEKHCVNTNNSYFPSNVTNNTNFLCFSSQENNSSSTDSGNTFSTTTSSDHQTLKNDSLSMVFSLEDAKLFSHSFPWDDNLSQLIHESNLEPVKLVLADNDLHAKEEHEMMVCEPYYEHRSKNLENPAKRLRSSIEVSKSVRNVRKNSRAANNPAATDAQSIYARGLQIVWDGPAHMVRRRERINERLKILQNLVPNGTKVDISTMLEEAVQYVKFLQHQIKLLSSDDLWMYAPLAFNGINIGLDHIM